MMNPTKTKVKQPDLTKIEILILSALGEIANRLEDILKGARRKFESHPNEFMENYVNLMWRAPEIYNFCYVKFGYYGREDLKNYINNYLERIEINDAWESLEDIEALWNDFIYTVSRNLKLNEEHEDKFIKYYFSNTKQLFDYQNQEIVQYENIMTQLSIVVLFPVYIPGTILSNLLKEFNKIEKELHVFGVDVKVILFGSNKKVKLWLKQYKIDFEKIYIDSSEEILKARRNMNTIFCTTSMETIGLSSKQKMRFIIPDDVNWERNLFPGGLAVVNTDTSVYYEHLCNHIGQFPSSDDIIDSILSSFNSINGLSMEEGQKYLKDGMKYYIIPDFGRMRYEVNSGFYYDPITSLYYESKSGYFYDGQRGIYLYWCKNSKCYLPVASYTNEQQVAVESTEDGSVIREAIKYQEQKEVEKSDQKETNKNKFNSEQQKSIKDLDEFDVEPKAKSAKLFH